MGFSVVLLVILAICATPSMQEPRPEAGCSDTWDTASCQEIAKIEGRCDLSGDWAHLAKECKKTCGLCGGESGSASSSESGEKSSKSRSSESSSGSGSGSWERSSASESSDSSEKSEEQPHGGGSKPSSGRSRYIIDTDPGGDDVHALIYALGAHKDDIAAVTVTIGNGELEMVHENAYRVMKLMNATHIPLLMGARRPFRDQIEFDSFWGPDAIGNAHDIHPKFHEDDVPKTDGHSNAIDAIIHNARKYPGEVVMICLGPMTNLALAHTLEPNLPKLLKATYLGGGNSHGIGNIRPAAEFNFFADPEAAKVAIESFNATVIPWETSISHTAPWEWFNQWLEEETHQTTFLKQSYSVALEKMIPNGEDYQFIDQAVVAFAMNPEVFAGDCVPKHAVVETDGTNTRGQMIVDWRVFSTTTPNVCVVEKYEVNKIMKLFWDVVKKGKSDYAGPSGNSGGQVTPATKAPRTQPPTRTRRPKGKGKGKGNRRNRH